ncbi:MAG: amidohydrolase [Thermoprotei archaeon]|nr:amidohydrolase [Thermoprotei archaeon]
MLAVMGRLVYTGHEAPPVKEAYVVFNEESGNIIEVTTEKPKCEVIAEGEVITPAFIDAHSHIGMRRAGEHPSEGESNERMDSVMPLADALDSIYMDDKCFRESVEHGVLYSCVLPGSGNIIGGRAVVIRNYALTVEKAFIKYAGIKAALGFNPRSTTEWKGTRPYTRMGATAILRKILTKARNELRLVKDGKKRLEEVEPEVAALFPVVEGKERLRVHVHKMDDVLVLFRFKSEFNLDVVIDHACDIYREEDFRRIKEEGIPIVYGPVDAFPYKTELKHESWRNIGALVKVNPYFGLMTDHPVILQRNLFLQLRFFRRFGVSKEKAISIITKRNATILGIQDRLGTLEAGKWASFVLWNGDPFSLEAYPVEVYAEGKRVFSER